MCATNCVVELEDVLPGARELTDRLRDTRDWGERFDHVEAFLSRRLALSPAPSPEIEWSWRELARTGGSIQIAALVEELGWSPRRLIARFREQIGLAPKAAAEVIRFDRAAAALRSAEPPTFASLAYRCGSADQAHLNRAFRRFAGTTPSAFLTSLTEAGGLAANSSKTERRAARMLSSSERPTRRQRCGARPSSPVSATTTHTQRSTSS